MDAALRRIAELLAGGAVDATSFPWWRLRYEHTQWVRSELSARYSPAYSNKILAALRGVLREAWRLGLLSRDDYERARDLPQVRGRALPRGRALTGEELERLLSASIAGGAAGGLRDAALVALLYGAGLRRSELVALDLSDLSLPRGEVVVRRGKGQKDRRVYISADVAEVLGRWVKVRGDEAGALFCRVLRGGHVRRVRLSAQTVYDVLRRRGDEAGLRPIAPHDLRRTTVTELLRGGADLGVVQRILGHESVATTLRYDQRGEAAEREAACRLGLPSLRARESERETASATLPVDETS